MWAAVLAIGATVRPRIAWGEEKPLIKTVYIIPSSHWDFSFIRTPEDEQAEMKPHLDAVLAACARDPLFRWTIESVWQLSAWLDRTEDTAKIAEMKARIASGQIEVSASWGSMHTEFLGTEELNRLEDEGRSVARRIPFQGDMAMENDVPGFSLRLPQVLAKSGVRYLMNGSNAFIGGGTSLSPRLAPFYWASPDGSRALTWTTRSKDGGYTEGLTDYYLDPGALDPYLHTPFYPKEWKGLPDEEIMARGVRKLLEHYTDAGYTGHSIAVLFMHDGIGPEYEESLLRHVRRWNEAGRLPQLKVATPYEYFTSFTPEELAALPTYKGDWSGLWSESKAGSPGMSGDARYIQEALPLADEAASISQWIQPTHPGQEDTLHTAAIDLMCFDEHNGSGNTGWPKVLTEDEVNRSNAEYAGYVRDARSRVDKVLDEEVPGMVETRNEPSTRRFIVVSNLRSWRRTDIVEADAPSGSFVIRDALSHATVPTQRLPSGRLMFLARDVPAAGYKSYLLEPSGRVEPSLLVDEAGRIENKRYAIDIDMASGRLLHIMDKKLTRDLVAAGGLTLRRSGKVEDGDGNVKVQRVQGPVEDQVIILRPSSWWAKTVISLPHEMNEVRVEQVLDRSKMPTVLLNQPADHYTISFPFEVESPGDEWVDDGIGFHRFPEDQLPGARTDGVVPRFVIELTSPGEKPSNNLLFAQRESFFVSAAKTHGDLEVLALSKSDQGDTKDHGVVTFKTVEPGYGPSYDFHFRFRSENSTFNPVETYRFGREDIVPLRARLLPVHTAPKVFVQTMLSVSSPNVVIDDLRPRVQVCADCYLLRLQEIAGEPTTTSFISPGQRFSAVRTDLTGTVAAEPIDLSRISLGPHETVTLQLRRIR